MRVIITYKRVPTTSAYGDGIQIIQTFYATPEEIDRIEKTYRENIGTALVINREEKQNESRMDKYRFADIRRNN